MMKMIINAFLLLFFLSVYKKLVFIKCFRILEINNLKLINVIVL